MSMRKQKKRILKAFQAYKAKLKAASTTFNAEIQAKEISRFFGFDKVPCSADVSTAIRVLKNHGNAEGLFTVLAVNREKELPREMAMAYNLPFIVVDPRNDVNKVNEILSSTLVETHFLVEKGLSWDSLKEKLSRFVPQGLLN